MSIVTALRTTATSRILLSATVVLACTLVVGAASAQPTVIFEGNTATGIENLMVNGTLYNVEFVFESGNSLYGTNPRVFDFDETGAIAAVEAARTALNGEPAVTMVGPDDSPRFRVGYSEALGQIVSQKSDYAGTWLEGDIQLDGPDDIESYAKFTMTTQTLSTTWGQIKSLLR